MTLYLVGHDHRFALEEGVLAHLGLKPDAVVMRDAPPPPAENQIISRLSFGATGLATCTATIRFGGRVTLGVSRVTPAGMDEVDARRELSHALKIALAKAAARLSGGETPWGSLSGMRPSKLAMKLVERHADGGDMARAVRSTMDTLTGRYLVRRDRAALTLACAAHGLRAKSALKPNQIALYVGIPFCPTRCSYCSFVSHSVERESSLVEPYLDALCDEIERRGALVRRLGLSVTSLYIGGGTPTVLHPQQLERLLSTLARQFDLSPLYEYTVEAGRPDTITAAKLDTLRAHGVTRISINPQSMDPNVLRLAHRAHTPSQVVDTFNMARRAGFDNINMDIIAGMDGDTPETFYATLDALLSLSPENITVHTLARKRGSDLSQAFGTGGGASTHIPTMLEKTFSLLPAHGYSPYYLYRQKYTSSPGVAGVGENTGWSKQGRECYYNIVTMEELQTVLALGAGGITKLVNGGSVSRLSNSKHPREYMSGVAQHLAHDRRIHDFIGNTERISHGIQP